MEIAGLREFSDIDSKYTAKQTLGKEEFMTLLLKQLSYQDPLNPMDNTEFTAQLTQFSSLEELNNINSTLENVLSFQQSMQNATVTNMIGKTVEVPGNKTYLDNTADMRYSLSEDAKSVKITIFDEGGAIVRTEENGPQTAGAYGYVWDGTNNDGNPMSEGTYTFEIEALDSSGNQIETVTNSFGKVTGILFEDDMTYLKLNDGRNVYLSDIKSINQ